jgi:hypothetical protein
MVDDGPLGYVQARARYMAMLGELIVTWNQAESTLRTLLYYLCGGTTATHILTAELGAMGIYHGLKSIAPTMRPEVQVAIECVADRYDLLREYRNYYVHGITGVGFVPRQDAVGHAWMASAKGKLRVAEDKIPLTTLDQIAGNIALLREAAADILDEIHPVPGSRAHPPLPSPQTLPPLARLEKSLRYLLATPPPPSPSGG